MARGGSFPLGSVPSQSPPPPAHPVTAVRRWHDVQGNWGFGFKDES